MFFFHSFQEVQCLIFLNLTPSDNFFILSSYQKRKAQEIMMLFHTLPFSIRLSLLHKKDQINSSSRHSTLWGQTRSERGRPFLGHRHRKGGGRERRRRRRRRGLDRWRDRDVLLPPGDRRGAAVQAAGNVHKVGVNTLWANESIG